MADVSLSDLFSAISRAMLDAQQAVSQASVNQYWNYFRPEDGLRDSLAGQAGVAEGEALVPLMRKIVIPALNGKGVASELSVPLVSLVNHGSFSLEQVTLKMRVAASVDEAGGPLKVSVLPALRKDERLEATGGQDAMPDTAQEIELVFRREAPAEGISRITTEAIKLL